MKNVMMGLLSLILAFGAVAFTKENKSVKSGSYWFQLNPTTGAQIPQTSVPTSSASDPNGCALTATQYCSRQYSDYEVVPGSSPTQYRGKTGTEGVTHKKN